MTSVIAILVLGASPALAEELPPEQTVVESPAPVEPAPVVPVDPPPAPPAPPEQAPPPEEPVAPTPPVEQQAPPVVPAPEPAPVPVPAPADTAAETVASEPAPPYLRWYIADAADPNASPLNVAASFTLQGPRNAAAAGDAEEAVAWAGASTSVVEDNVGDSAYAGLDRDPRPGWFTVEQVVDGATGALHEVQASETYRVRAMSGPAGFTYGESAEWAEFGSFDAVVGDGDAHAVLLGTPAPQRPSKPEALVQVAAVCPTGWPVAGPPLAGFELDGNLCVNDTAYQDWASVGGQPAANDGFGDSTWFKQGASESNWSSWDASNIGGSANLGSADMGNVYALSSTVGGNVYGFLGFERFTNTGSIAYYVELNQKTNSLGPIPDRTVGDLRLTINQTGSNTIALVGAHRWNGTAWVSLGSLAGFVGQVNQGTVQNLSGTSLNTGTFAEVGINLTALFGSAGCSGNYGTLNVRSAASPSETSSLRDYIAPISLNVPSTCASVQVVKSWVIDGTTYKHGEQPFGAATLSLTGQTSPQFGTIYTNQTGGAAYLAGQSITIGENVTGLPAGCVNVPSGTGGKTLTAGLNSFTVTNTVTCTTLTLVKSVSNTHGGTGAVDDWTLTATGPTGGVTGITGSTAVTNRLVANGDYALTESTVPGYEMVGWECLNGTEPMTVTNDTVTIPQGAQVTCTVTNRDLAGSVTWSKVAVGTTTLLEGSKWTLVGPGHASPGTIITDCTSDPCAGTLDLDPVAGQFELSGLDWGDYTLTESQAPPGFLLDTSEHPFSITGATAGTAIQLGDIDNVPVVAPAIPLTGGIGRDEIMLVGAGVLAIALLSLSLMRLTNSRRRASL